MERSQTLLEHSDQEKKRLETIISELHNTIQKYKQKVETMQL